MRIRAFPLLVATASISGLSSGSYAQAIRVDGASAGTAIGKLAVEEFQKIKKDALHLVPGISGSAGGLRKLCANAIDVANSARPMLKEELAACQKAGMEFIELPVAFDAVTVVVNRRNDFVTSLTVDELKRVWGVSAQGKVVRWSQVNARFPNAPLKLLGPDSQYEQANTFTEAILGPGQPARHDYMASVDDRVLVQGVARDVNTLSYLPYAIYLENRGTLKLVPIVSSTNGAAANPSPEATASEAYALLVRPLFLYVNAKSLEKPMVREFVEFTLMNGKRLVQAARYTPLSEAAYKLGLAHVRGRSIGTAWGGTVPVGVTPGEVEKRLATL
ncbi:MAG TPA: substrate-binding domain-containing protein [Burkholderiales bacterium]|nr:substrate-binding domain-containing protein [Burkholderiales bacterium]